MKRVQTPPPLPPLDIPRGPAGIGASAPLWLVALALFVSMLMVMGSILQELGLVSWTN